MPDLIRVTDTATRLELAKAITVLRDKQIAAELDATKAEVQVAIDDLLGRWSEAR